MKKLVMSGLVLLALSGVSYAQNVTFTGQNTTQTTNNSSSQVRDLKSLINFIIEYINRGIYLLMAIATIAFVYNVVMFFVVKSDSDHAEARRYLIMSIVGLAVIISFWGLVNIVIQTFALNNTPPNINQLYFNR